MRLVRQLIWIPCCAAICLLWGAAGATQLIAQGVTLPADTKLVVQLDLAEFSKTTLGERLVKLTSKTAAEEIGTDGENLIAKVHETLGFDPLNEIQSITLAVSSLDRSAVESLSAIVQMGSTTGNLEGLLLALPNYESTEHGEYTLHSVNDGKDIHATATIHADTKDDHWIFIAPTREQLITLLGSNAEGDGQGGMEVKALAAGAFLAAELSEIPSERVRQEPFRNIVGLLRSLKLTVREDGETLQATLNVGTANERKAQQIQQLIQGLSAAASLAFDSVDELKQQEIREAAMATLNSLTVSRDDAEVTVTVSVSTEMIVKFLREEADLPL